MRILLVHNHYSTAEPSGEGAVFDLERRLLLDRGHDVEVFERHSDDLHAAGLPGLLRGAVSAPWNPFAARDLRKVATRFRPHVVHAHNTFPLISAAIFPAIPEPAGRVLTLHNYRLFCAAGAPFRDGRVCTTCIDTRSALPALRHGCYRGSRLSTLPLALGVAVQRWRGVWQSEVDAFIALTDFQRETMVNGGLPAARVHVKPNFHPGRPEVRPWEERRPEIVFVGRMTEVKGVRVLLEAWRRWGPEAPRLSMIGDGPLRGELERAAAEARLDNIAFRGLVPRSEAQEIIAGSRLLVLPALWFEGFPMVLQEAMAFGTPSVVSEVGGLPGIVGPAEAGAVASPGDPDHLLEVIRGLWADPDRLRRMGGRARAEFEQRYQEETNYRALIGIYERAIEERRSRTARTAEVG